MSIQRVIRCCTKIHPFFHRTTCSNKVEARCDYALSPHPLPTISPFIYFFTPIRMNESRSGNPAIQRGVDFYLLRFLSLPSLQQRGKLAHDPLCRMTNVSNSQPNLLYNLIGAHNIVYHGPRLLYNLGTDQKHKISISVWKKCGTKNH